MFDFKLKVLNFESTHFDYEVTFEKTESFAQRVLLTLNTWKDEFAYDTDKGIDYHTVLKENFSTRSLEAFFLFSLKKQLKDFSTFDGYKLDYNQSTQTAHISFTAYSLDGEEVVIDNFEI